MLQLSPVNSEWYVREIKQNLYDLLCLLYDTNISIIKKFTLEFSNCSDGRRRVFLLGFAEKLLSLKLNLAN